MVVKDRDDLHQCGVHSAQNMNGIVRENFEQYSCALISATTILVIITSM